MLKESDFTKNVSFDFMFVVGKIISLCANGINCTLLCGGEGEKGWGGGGIVNLVSSTFVPCFGPCG